MNPADGPHALRDLLDFYREVLHRATPRIIVGYPNCGRDMILAYRASNGSDRDTILCGKRAWRHYIQGLGPGAKPDTLRHERYSMSEHWAELRNLTTHYAPTITVRQT